jgi:hypothetical protein
LEFPRYSKLDIKQKSKKIEKTVLLIKKPVETLLLLKLLKLKISAFPLKYKKVAIRADKKPIKDKKRYNLFLCLSL